MHVIALRVLICDSISMRENVFKEISIIFLCRLISLSQNYCGLDSLYQH